MKMSTTRTYFAWIIVAIYVILPITICQETTTACNKAARTEAYIETAAGLLSQARESMPPEGGTDCSCPPKPMDCDEVMQCGQNRSGVYEIWPRNRIMSGSITVFCDMETNGGGWTVIQRRGNFKRPSDFFLKRWHLYKSGFGDLRRDFWLGNDNIYALTNQKKYYLRIDLSDHQNNSRYAFYDQFWIDNESQFYKLHIYDFSGDAGDSLARAHGNQQFSTIDRDNDNSTRLCANEHKGGWWYADCADSNLNGLYKNLSEKNSEGIVWRTWKGMTEPLKFVEMKVRPADFKTDLLDMDIEPA
ncbi:techylectin-5A isoform X1 [Parasteatoda tepidariorum]|uniref:techylectin-5A isoform X1 n=1 Tax=Parasteatoda tepidariorum TaxID=114398 RepID=UPI001C71BF9A|nr:techylectin-5A isoform X1 [Parasteatoda tepidariorum]